MPDRDQERELSGGAGDADRIHILESGASERHAADQPHIEPPTVNLPPAVLAALRKIGQTRKFYMAKLSPSDRLLIAAAESFAASHSGLAAEILSYSKEILDALRNISLTREMYSAELSASDHALLLQAESVIARSLAVSTQMSQAAESEAFEPTAEGNS